MESDANDRIEKLWGHLGNMNPEQIREHIRRIRSDRRITKIKKAAKKATRVKSDGAATKIRKIAESDPDLLRKMLEQMNGKG